MQSISTKRRIWYPWKEQWVNRTLGRRWNWWDWPCGLVALWPPVAPRGPAGFVLASVSVLSRPHLCWALLIFPPVSCSSHGLVRPPPGPHPEPGSSFTITRSVCVCVRVCVYRTIARMQLKSRGLWAGMSFTFDPWEVGDAKYNSTFWPYFSPGSS